MRLPQLVTSLFLRLVVLAACVLFLAPSAFAGPRIVSREAVPDESAEEVVEESAPEDGAHDAAPDVVSIEGSDTTVVVVSRRRRGPSGPSGPPANAHAPAFDPRGVEVGMRFGTFTAGNDWIDEDGSANYGGFGMVLRGRFFEAWSFELGIDSVFRSTDTETLREDRSIMNLGALMYFGEPDWGQSYMSFGFMGSTANLSGDNTELSAYGEGGLYAGIGADLYFDNLRLNSELRLAALGRDEEDTLIEPLPEGEYVRTAPDERLAAQWFISVLYSF